MNKNKIFGIFILFALLITCIGVSFASSDFDAQHVVGAPVDDDVIDDDFDDDYPGDDDDDYSDDDSDDEDLDDDEDDWDDDWDDDDYWYGEDDKEWDDYYLYDGYLYPDDAYWGNYTQEYYYDNLDWMGYCEEDYDAGDFNETGNGTYYKVKLLKTYRLAYTCSYSSKLAANYAGGAMNIPETSDDSDDTVSSCDSDSKPDKRYDACPVTAPVVAKTAKAYPKQESEILNTIDAGEITDDFAPADSKNTSKPIKTVTKVVSEPADEDFNIFALLAALLVSLIVLI